MTPDDDRGINHWPLHLSVGHSGGLTGNFAAKEKYARIGRGWFDNIDSFDWLDDDLMRPAGTGHIKPFAKLPGTLQQAWRGTLD